MFVEESIVKTHLKSIYLKVGCVNKNKLLVLIMQARLVLQKEAGKPKQIIIFDIVVMYLFYFLLKISYFWGEDKQINGMIKYSCKMKSYICLFERMKGGWKCNSKMDKAGKPVMTRKTDGILVNTAGFKSIIFTSWQKSSTTRLTKKWKKAMQEL